MNKLSIDENGLFVLDVVYGTSLEMRDGIIMWLFDIAKDGTWDGHWDYRFGKLIMSEEFATQFLLKWTVDA